MPVVFGAGSKRIHRNLRSAADRIFGPPQIPWIDETYIRIKSQDRYLYRAVDSTGQTIEFLLTAKRDAAATRFLVKAIEASGNAMPLVMNVDKNPAYPAAVEALKAEGTLPRRVHLRKWKYLNNLIEQDHRIVKKRGRHAL